MRTLYWILLGLFNFILCNVLTSCSTTTHCNLTDNSRFYIRERIKDAQKNEDVGIEVSISQKSGNVVNGELLSVRDSIVPYVQNIQQKKKNWQNIFILSQLFLIMIFSG